MSTAEYRQAHIAELPQCGEVALYPDRSENLLPDKGCREVFKRERKTEMRRYGRVCKYERRKG